MKTPVEQLIENIRQRATLLKEGNKTERHNSRILFNVASTARRFLEIEREFIEQVRAGIDAPEKDETIPDSAQ
jgi:hypothetical protein